MSYLTYSPLLFVLIGGLQAEPLISNTVKGNLQVINGSSVSIETYPWDVSFLVANNIWGAGAILSSNWIVTSAFNCLWLEPTYITIRAGSANWTSGGQLLLAEKCILHPDYNGTWHNNIALLKLKEGITINNTTTKTISFPTLKGATSKGKNFTVTGWGVRSNEYQKEDLLQSAPQTVLANNVCNNTYPVNSTTTYFCAQNSQAGPCVFDFGAPLINPNNKIIRLNGLYIGSQDCTRPDLYPALYVDVFQFVNWINNTITNDP